MEVQDLSKTRDNLLKTSTLKEQASILVKEVKIWTTRECTSTREILLKIVNHRDRDQLRTEIVTQAPSRQREAS